MVTGIPRVRCACQAYVFMAYQAWTSIALKYMYSTMYDRGIRHVVWQRIDFVTAQQEMVLN